MWPDGSQIRRAFVFRSVRVKHGFFFPPLLSPLGDNRMSFDCSLVEPTLQESLRVLAFFNWRLKYRSIDQSNLSSVRRKRIRETETWTWFLYIYIYVGLSKICLVNFILNSCYYILRVISWLFGKKNSFDSM